MSSAINNAWFSSADVIIQGNVENVKRDHCTGRGQGFCFVFVFFSSLPENTNRTTQEEEANVNVSGENNTLSLSLHWLVQGHTGVTKSYRFMADGRAGLVSE